jgi:hypothetical protein
MTPDREHIPTIMPTGNRPQNLGKTINDDTSRLDAVAKVTGRARYARDRYLPDSLFAGFVRCPYGAGELEAADADAARAVPRGSTTGIRSATSWRSRRWPCGAACGP